MKSIQLSSLNTNIKKWSCDLNDFNKLEMDTNLCYNSTKHTAIYSVKKKIFHLKPKKLFDPKEISFHDKNLIWIY